MIKVTIALAYYPELGTEEFNTSLKSALSQDYSSFQVIIFHEGKLPEEFGNKCNKTIPVPDFLWGNPSGVREFMVSNIETEFLAFWDSDDYYTVDRLSVQMDSIAKTGTDLCFSDFSFFNEKQHYSETFFDIIGFWQRPINLLDENYVGLGICTGKTEMFKKLLPFPAIRTLDWWVAISASQEGYKLTACKETHGYYRIKTGSLSARYERVTKEDFVGEIKNKLSLYQVLPIEMKGVPERISYFKSIDLERDFEELKNKYEQNKYKNIWGGLIKYE